MADVIYRWTGATFHVQKVLDRYEATRERAMKRIGAWIRIAAKRSIRKRKKSAEPPNPPHSHTGHLKNLIFFGMDQKTDNVFIGPVIFHGAKRKKVDTVRNINQTTPQRLEHGGSVRVIDSRGRRRGVERRMAHPYMGPSHEKATKSDKLKRFWDVVR